MIKKPIILSILTLFMWYTGIKGTIFVLNNPYFHYNGLPLWGVHCILVVYLLLGVIVTILAIIKWVKLKHR